MVAEPAATPVTSPVTGFTVAAAVLLLLQLPPPVPLLVNIAVAAAHSVLAPLTVPALGRLPTVTTTDALTVPHTEVTVYLIVELPAATPVTTPVVAFTVAAAVLVLLQVPPPVPSLDKVVVEPVHRKVVPLIVPAFGSGLTVIAAVAVAVPQVVVTV